MRRSTLDRVREIALALPEVNERRSHGEPCFFVRDKRPIAYYHDDHHGDGRVSVWCPAPPGARDELVNADPVRFFRPEPSASGVFDDWVGIFLDNPRPSTADWHEITAIIEDAYRHVAPNSLIKLLETQRRTRSIPGAPTPPASGRLLT